MSFNANIILQNYRERFNIPLYFNNNLFSTLSFNIYTNNPFFRNLNNNSLNKMINPSVKKSTILIVAHGRCQNHDPLLINRPQHINSHVSYVVPHHCSLFRERGDILYNQFIFTNAEKVMKKYSYSSSLSVIPDNYHYIAPHFKDDDKGYLEFNENKDVNFFKALNNSIFNNITVAIFSDLNINHIDYGYNLIYRTIKETNAEIGKIKKIKNKYKITLNDLDRNEFINSCKINADLNKRKTIGKNKLNNKSTINDETLYSKDFDIYKNYKSYSDKKDLLISSIPKEASPNLLTIIDTEFYPSFPVINEFSKYFENIIFVTCRSRLNCDEVKTDEEHTKNIKNGSLYTWDNQILT